MNEKTGTPLLATVVTGVLSALMSLFVGLAVLVELMSIGKPNPALLWLVNMQITLDVLICHSPHLVSSRVVERVEKMGMGGDEWGLVGSLMGMGGACSI